jgi:BolA protein
MNTGERIQQRLSALAPESLEILDESAQHVGHAGAQSGGGHYQLIIVSRLFDGKTLAARHRMVYEALGTMMQLEIHALAIMAYAPDEI